LLERYYRGVVTRDLDNHQVFRGQRGDLELAAAKFDGNQGGGRQSRLQWLDAPRNHKPNDVSRLVQ
jgi:hypothetical protein